MSHFVIRDTISKRFLTTKNLLGFGSLEEAVVFNSLESADQRKREIMLTADRGFFIDFVPFTNGLLVPEVIICKVTI